MNRLLAWIVGFMAYLGVILGVGQYLVNDHQRDEIERLRERIEQLEPPSADET